MVDHAFTRGVRAGGADRCVAPESRCRGLVPLDRYAELRNQQQGHTWFGIGNKTLFVYARDVQANAVDEEDFEGKVFLTDEPWVVMSKPCPVTKSAGFPKSGGKADLLKINVYSTLTHASNPDVLENAHDNDTLFSLADVNLAVAHDQLDDLWVRKTQTITKHAKTGSPNVMSARLSFENPLVWAKFHAICDCGHRFSRSTMVPLTDLGHASRAVNVADAKTR